MNKQELVVYTVEIEGHGIYINKQPWSNFMADLELFFNIHKGKCTIEIVKLIQDDIPCDTII